MLEWIYLASFSYFRFNFEGCVLVLLSIFFFLPLFFTVCCNYYLLEFTFPGSPSPWSIFRLRSRCRNTLIFRWISHASLYLSGQSGKEILAVTLVNKSPSFSARLICWTHTTETDCCTQTQKQHQPFILITAPLLKWRFGNEALVSSLLFSACLWVVKMSETGDCTDQYWLCHTIDYI